MRVKLTSLIIVLSLCIYRLLSGIWVTYAFLCGNVSHVAVCQLTCIQFKMEKKTVIWFTGYYS